ncbi:MAG: SMC family ATPase [Clostridia bacterium]|nr:SMC family ATPase [Clostridia bacterium]
MKPIKLKIEGVKSFSSAVEIDFKKLISAGMFGIFGDTGSGKSTILESIICSIYSSKFKTEYINKRCNFAEIYFTFELVVLGKRTTYEVYRKFVKSGQPKAVLYEYKSDNTKFVLAEKQRQVDEKLAEIIGLNCEEFESSIVLLQGKFDRFLNATRINRVKIMESLFSLQKYGENLKENTDKLNLKYLRQEADFKGKLSLLEDVNEDVLNNLKLELEESKKELDLANEKNSNINDYIEKYAPYYNGEIRQKEIENELNLLAKDTPYFTRLKENLQKLNDVKNYVNLSEEIAKIEREIIELNSNVNSLNFELKNSTKNLNLLKENLTSSSTTIEQKTEELSSLAVSVEKVKLLNEQLDKNLIKLCQIDNQIKTEKELLNLDKLELQKLKNEFKKLEGNKISLDFEEAFSSLEKSLTTKAKAVQVLSEKEFLLNLINLVKQAPALDAIDIRLKVLEGVLSENSQTSKNYSEHILLLKELLDKKVQVENEKIKIESEISVKASEVGLKENSSKQLMQSRQSLLDENEALTSKINDLSNGKNLVLYYDESLRKLNSLKQKKIELENLQQNLQQKVNGTEISIASSNAKIDGLTRLIKEKTITFNELGKTLNLSVEKCRQIIVELGTNNVIEDTENHFKKVMLLTEESKKLAKNIKDSTYNSSVYQEFLQKKGEIHLNLLNLTENFAKIKNNYEKSEQKYKYKCIIEKDYNILAKKMQLLQTLTSLVSSRKLLEFIADEYLAEICVIAKKTLFTLSSGKYGLVYDGEFFVTDNLNGGEKRQASTLSGGETFIVSLSLALALSTEIHYRSMRPIEFFFLDEGFGTLDKSLTETVISCLNKLKNQNFTIGLISHVDELKDAVNARIDVTGATLTSGSSIKITTN